VISQAGQPEGQPNLKKPTALRGAVGVWDCESSDRIKRLSPNGVEGRIGWWIAPEFAILYATGAAFLLLCEWYERSRSSAS
jgi:hypothetical protein